MINAGAVHPDVPLAGRGLEKKDLQGRPSVHPEIDFCMLYIIYRGLQKNEDCRCSLCFVVCPGRNYGPDKQASTKKVLSASVARRIMIMNIHIKCSHIT